MRSLTLVLLFIFSGSSLHSQIINREFPEKDGSIKLLGQATYGRLKAPPFDGWFVKNESSFQPADSAVETFQNALRQVDSITLFMGTWCGDSKREVPRLTKLLNEAGFDMKKLKIICLDNTFSNYKQSPEKEQMNLNIHRVPTVIFQKDGSELGRIVESPVDSYSADLSAILENTYHPKFQSVNFLHRYLSEHGTRALLQNQENVLSELTGKTDSWNELTTYGKVLLTSWRLKEAVTVLEINSRLYPDKEYVFLHLANAYYLTGDTENAEKCCRKALSINPESHFATTLLKKID